MNDGDIHRVIIEIGHARKRSGQGDKGELAFFIYQRIINHAVIYNGLSFLYKERK
ncbi:MAG: hypothetical protein WCJ37_03740 [Syntrophus sp. (in: bacteria)]